MVIGKLIKMRKMNFLFTLGIMAGLFGAELSGKSPDDMNMKAGLIDCRTTLKYNSSVGYAIHISIKNTSESDLVFFRDYLPWRSPLLTTVVAIPLNPSDSPILPIAQLTDPTVNQVTLKPGDLLEGDMILNKYFNKFSQLIAHKEVSIFWSFVLENAESKRFGRYSGFSIISPSDNPK